MLALPKRVIHVKCRNAILFDFSQFSVQFNVSYVFILSDKIFLMKLTKRIINKTLFKELRRLIMSFLAFKYAILNHS